MLNVVAIVGAYNEQPFLEYCVKATGRFKGTWNSAL